VERKGKERWRPKNKSSGLKENEKQKRKRKKLRKARSDASRKTR